MGTAWHENHESPSDFSRAGESAPDTARAAVLYGNPFPYLRASRFQGLGPYKEKRTLPGALADVSDFVCVTARDPCGPISVSRFGNIDPTPFRWNTGKNIFFFRARHCPRFRTELSYLLGPTDPCSTAVHMEPFSTSVFKVLV
ncbi:uncharacterized protein LOC121366912 [Gigantopelta aegis]|uniref:uncharacterized protein LOC121366912 n=1 Tax=Gigantopelta aegis TaxID=1735272 RepID=UPI001B88CBE6|nr:uncharacterized protein LOC121366912 [Gigantopelta aegis]